MNRPILLDACALIWVATNCPLTVDAEAALQAMEPIAGGIAVSPISAWESGQPAAKGRLRLPTDPSRWFQAVLDGGMTLALMPSTVLVASSFLPSGRLREPADKILAATARAFDYRLMTRDQLLLDFADEGDMRAIPC